MRLVRQCDQDEREIEGAVHLEFDGSQTAESISEGLGGKNSRTQIGFNTFMKETTRRGSSTLPLETYAVVFLEVTFKTSLFCTGTTRTHVETCVRVVPVHTGTFLNVHTETC